MSNGKVMVVHLIDGLIKGLIPSISIPLYKNKSIFSKIL